MKNACSLNVTSRSFFSNSALARTKASGITELRFRDGVSSLLSLRQGDTDRLQRNRQSRNASANSDGRLIQTTCGIDRILSS